MPKKIDSKKIWEALVKYRGNVSKTARELKISRQTIYNMLERKCKKEGFGQPLIL